MTVMLYVKHKKGLRLIKEVKNRVSYRILFGDFKILTVTLLYIFEILCFIKINKSYMTQYSDIHKYNTQGKWDLYVQLCSTAHYKNSVINMGIKIHYNLPCELKGIENFKVFKNKLKNYLLQNCFYSLQKFHSNNDRR
jgi:hypothetical protein